MSECMQFPDTWEEFEQAYGFEDKKEIYTNGSRLIQSFRVKQWLDHTAEPERKKGEWSNYKDEHCCSVCKCVVISNCWDDEIRYDYCPYCGAKME